MENQEQTDYVSVEGGEAMGQPLLTERKLTAISRAPGIYMQLEEKKEQRETEIEIRLFENYQGIYISCILATEFDLMGFLSST